MVPSQLLTRTVEAADTVKAPMPRRAPVRIGTVDVTRTVTRLPRSFDTPAWLLSPVQPAVADEVCTAE